jgi:hypothetical protein
VLRARGDRAGIVGDFRPTGQLTYLHEDMPLEVNECNADEQP